MPASLMDFDIRHSSFDIHHSLFCFLHRPHETDFIHFTAPLLDARRSGRTFSSHAAIGGGWSLAILAWSRGSLSAIIIQFFILFLDNPVLVL
jgi:hypothetical protein